jgi:hypothetical protein
MMFAVIGELDEMWQKVDVRKSGGRADFDAQQAE